MTGRRTVGSIVLIAGLVAGGSFARAQTAQAPPDNTRANRRDRAPAAKTADQQGNSKADVERTRQIRRAIVADKTLSTYAHNVKVITRDGHVTLKGPVRSAGERSTLEAKATEVAGAGNVTDQLTVTSSNTKTRTSRKGK